jgi:hypothetical protein
MAIPDELKKKLLPSLTGKPETTEREMMGTTAFHVRGRMFAFWMPDGIVVRTPRDSHAALMAEMGGSAFSGPQGRGAGDWLRLPVTEENLDTVRATIDDAYRYVAGAAKPAQRRKKKR